MYPKTINSEPLRRATALCQALFAKIVFYFEVQSKRCLYSVIVFLQIVLPFKFCLTHTEAKVLPKEPSKSAVDRTARAKTYEHV